MPKETPIQTLWNLVDRLKVLMDSNPKVPIKEAQKIVEEMETIIKDLRKREIRESN